MPVLALCLLFLHHAFITGRVRSQSWEILPGYLPPSFLAGLGAPCAPFQETACASSLLGLCGWGCGSHRVRPKCSLEGRGWGRYGQTWALLSLAGWLVRACNRTQLLLRVLVLPERQLPASLFSCLETMCYVCTHVHMCASCVHIHVHNP